MKFKVTQKDLATALNVIKGSKSLSRGDKDDAPPIKISANKQEVTFVAFDGSVWAGSSIKVTQSDKINNLEILENGYVFVDGNDFVNMISHYPKESIIEFEVVCGDGDSQSLNVNCADPSKNGRTRSSTFLTTDPGLFSEKPPKEKRIVAKVSTEDFSKIVNLIEFATGQNEVDQHLWGVQVSLHGGENISVYQAKDISACATNRSVLMWYDEEGINRKITKKPIFLNPIKNSLIAALKRLNNKIPSTLEIGERYTILRQEGQWHGLPNVIMCKTDELPKWREIAKILAETCANTIEISRALVSDFIKTTMSTSCSKYGVSIFLDTDKGKIKLSIQDTKTGASLKSSHVVTDKISKEQITGDSLKGEFSLLMDGFKEIINKCKSDMVVFHIADCRSPIQIEDKNSCFRYIASVADND